MLLFRNSLTQFYDACFYVCVFSAKLHNWLKDIENCHYIYRTNSLILLPIPDMHIFKRPEIRITFIYILIALLWIYFSDKFLLHIVEGLDPKQLTYFQTAKGFFFVLFVGVVIFVLIKKSTTNLNRSQQEYHQLFLNNPNPMWIYDATTLAFMKVNNAALDTYGYTEEDFLSMTIKDIRTKGEAERLTEHLKKPSEDLSKSGTWKHLKKNGETIMVQVSTHSLVFHGKKCRLALPTDVTEKQALQDDLIKTNNELNVLINSITDGFFIMNKDFTILKSNPQLKSLAGVEDITGKNFADIFPKPNRLGYNKYIAAFETRQAAHFEEYFEPAKTWFRISAYPVENDLSVFFRDITYEKNNELNIVQNQRNLNALVNNTEDLIWSIDKDYHYMLFNHSFEKAYELNTGEKIKVGQSAANDKLSREEKSKWKNLYDRALHGEKFTIELDYPTPSFGTQFFSISLNPIYSTDNSINGVGCFLRNVTERRVNEERIRQQNKRFKDIAYLTSHIVRAPLANLLGLTEAIDVTNLSDPEHFKILKHIKTSAHQLDEVIKDIVNQTVLIKEEVVD